MPPVLSLHWTADWYNHLCMFLSFTSLSENDGQLCFARIPLTSRAGHPAGCFGICAQPPDHKQLRALRLPCDQLVVLLETAETMVERLHLVVVQEDFGQVKEVLQDLAFTSQRSHRGRQFFLSITHWTARLSPPMHFWNTKGLSYKGQPWSVVQTIQGKIRTREKSYNWH